MPGLYISLALFSFAGLLGLGRYLNYLEQRDLDNEEGFRERLREHSQ